MTMNAGRSWSRIGTLPLFECTLDFTTVRDGACTNSVGASVSATLQLADTHDSGRTWTTVFDNVAGMLNGARTHDGGLPYSCDKRFSLTPPATVWTEGTCDTWEPFLYRSVDDGRHWQPSVVPVPQPLVPRGTGFTGSVVLVGLRGAVTFAESNLNLIYATTDGGKRFIQVRLPGPERPWTVDIVSPIMWRLALRNEIVGTNNGGATWFGVTGNAFTSPTIRRSQRWSTGTPDTLNFTSSSFAWLTWSTGNGSTVLVTRDGGRKWNQVAVPGTVKPTA